MSENPYQPSSVEASTPVDSRLKKKCLQLMEIRQTGLHVGTYLKLNGRRQVIYLLVYALLAYYLWKLELTLTCATFVGFFLGRSLRDFRWWQVMAQEWPVTRELLDWEKIERIADESSVSEG